MLFKYYLLYMDFSKYRNSDKKSRQSKPGTLQQIPLAPLMLQINQLKSQLAEIKSQKSLKSGKKVQIVTEKSLKPAHSNLQSPKSHQKDSKPSLPTQPKQKQRERERQKQISIIFPIEQAQQKLTLNLTKLYSSLNQNDMKKTYQNLHKLIECLNSSIRELEIQNRNVGSVVGSVVGGGGENGSGWGGYDGGKQKLRVFQHINNQLEKQNIEFRHLLAKNVDQIQELKYQNSRLQAQYEGVLESLAGLEGEIQKSRILCEGLREQRRELEEKIRVYERSIEKKQSQILMHEQDINFARMQTDKHKSQKRELQKLLQSLQKDHKSLQNKYQIDTEALTKEKNKWRNQCQLRRTNQQQIIGQQQQKTHLKKQIQTSRKQLTSLIEELHTIKQRLCAEQKKNLSLEEKMFKLETENERLGRNLEYCRLEMKEMTAEVQEMRDQANKYRDIAVKNKIAAKNTGKAQALQQIQEMIRMHRKADEDQQ